MKENWLAEFDFDDKVAHYFRGNDVAIIQSRFVRHQVTNRFIVVSTFKKMEGKYGRTERWYDLVLKIPDLDQSEIICPKEYMGMIIGKSGKKIKEIEEKLSRCLKVVEYVPEKHNNNFPTNKRRSSLWGNNNDTLMIYSEGDYLGRLYYPPDIGIGYDHPFKREIIFSNADYTGKPVFRHPNSPAVPDGTVVKITKVNHFSKKIILEYEILEKISEKEGYYAKNFTKEYQTCRYSEYEEGYKKVDKIFETFSCFKNQYVVGKLGEKVLSENGTDLLTIFQEVEIKNEATPNKIVSEDSEDFHFGFLNKMFKPPFGGSRRY